MNPKKSCMFRVPYYDFLGEVLQMVSSLGSTWGSEFEVEDFGSRDESHKPIAPYGSFRKLGDPNIVP